MSPIAKCTVEVRRKLPGKSKPTLQKCGLLADRVKVMRVGGSMTAKAVLCPAHRDKAAAEGFVILRDE